MWYRSVLFERSPTTYSTRPTIAEPTSPSAMGSEGPRDHDAPATGSGQEKVVAVAVVMVS